MHQVQAEVLVAARRAPPGLARTQVEVLTNQLAAAEADRLDGRG